MSEGIVSTGSCIAFSAAAPTTVTATDYALLTWTNWPEVISLGNLGITTVITEYKTICDGFTNKRPASKDSGTMSVEAANVEDDAAQVILQAAIDATPVTSVSCRVTLASGAIRYFKAFPGSLEDQIGGPDDIFKTMVSLNIDGAIVRVAAP